MVSFSVFQFFFCNFLLAVSKFCDNLENTKLQLLLLGGSGAGAFGCQSVCESGKWQRENALCHTAICSQKAFYSLRERKSVRVKSWQSFLLPVAAEFLSFRKQFSSNSTLAKCGSLFFFFFFFLWLCKQQLSFKCCCCKLQFFGNAVVFEKKNINRERERARVVVQARCMCVVRARVTMLLA